MYMYIVSVISLVLGSQFLRTTGEKGSLGITPGMKHLIPHGPFSLLILVPSHAFSLC